MADYANVADTLQAFGEGVLCALSRRIGMFLFGVGESGAGGLGAALCGGQPLSKREVGLCRHEVGAQFDNHGGSHS